LTSTLVQVIGSFGAIANFLGERPEALSGF
jgi:hypothetical protein